MINAYTDYKTQRKVVNCNLSILANLFSALLIALSIVGWAAFVVLGVWAMTGGF